MELVEGLKGVMSNRTMLCVALRAEKKDDTISGEGSRRVWIGVKEMDDRITLEEVKDALKEARESAPRRDGVEYKALKSLQDINGLLDFYNVLWKRGEMPRQFKEAVIVLILKPMKDTLKADSYRPISLLLCVVKVYEKIVYKRLRYYVEQKKILPDVQNRFWPNRSTSDNIAILSGSLYEAINTVGGGEGLAVFLDIKKAVDNVSYVRLLQKLREVGLQGRMYQFLMSYLEGRRAVLRINGTNSEPFDIHDGAPQGSILSPLLFNLLLYDLPMDVGVQILQFADNVIVWIVGMVVEDMVMKLQKYLNGLCEYMRTNYLEFSEEKSAGVVFMKRFYKSYVVPDIKIHGKGISIDELVRCLGVILDKHLNFQEDAAREVSVCERRLSVMKYISSVRLGLDFKKLRKIHEAVIVSVLLYGIEGRCVMSKTAQAKLNVVQTKAIWMFVGLLRCTANPVTLIGGEKRCH